MKVEGIAGAKAAGVVWSRELVQGVCGRAKRLGKGSGVV